MALGLSPVPLRLRLHDRVLVATDRPLVMGVLNVTPDSFSDGGRHPTAESAVARAFHMAKEGADLIDIGGESTRPGAEPVTVEEETRRVLPILERLLEAGFSLPVSVDTRHAATARLALDRGAHIVNDVSALSDPGMVSVLLDSGAPAVLMHMQGEPRTMQAEPAYRDVVEEVMEGLAEKRDAAVEAGVSPGAIVLDPGLGFGKRTGGGAEDNCVLLSRLPRLHALGHPLLVGASRKRFIGNLTGAPVESRMPGSLAAALAAAWAGAAIVRVHDVAETVQALSVAAALDPSDWSTRWHGDHDPQVQKP
ncbi:MAG: dihydropteroate synthase [Euryarchaeota archaeon]|nr:dihydropteroate synthase [Euryarchaeota archaeon]